MLVTPFFQITDFSFQRINSFVEADEIRKNGYDLSINKYKEVEYEEVVYDSPKNILSDIKALEDEVQQGLKELEGIL